ncbi:MAG: polyribonucleotide nucleotidyltransferase [Parcubacteria group bacterium]
MDLNRKIFETEVAGRPLKLEVSRLAEQANAAVLATYGETSVLATVVMDKSDREGDFMPLIVDYEEKFYAAGKILGSQYVRREGKPSENAILSGRLIDRAIRPLFDVRIRRPIQVTATVLSYDEENDPDFAALTAVSTALGISDIPWGGPIAGVSIAKLGDRLVINPKESELSEKENDKKFLSFIAGLDGEVNMIEFEGYEADENEIIAAYAEAMKEIEKILSFERDVISKVGKTKVDVALMEPSEELKSAVSEFLSGRIDEALFKSGKIERENATALLKKELAAHILEKGFTEDDFPAVERITEILINDIVHKEIIANNRRPDGRALDELRELYAEVALLPRTHGSAVFIRGNTQSLATVTLAAPGQEKMIETIERVGKERFMLHYNFPGYSVGEAKSYRGPGRRDIGHGALAEKAVRSVIPSVDEFPYTIRVVSEILSSNGSSSMASVCSSIMALMDAGVPIKKPVAGIAMGLMSSEGEYKILTDIQGPEDHHGDMDFKVAGTKDGVNAIQMDVKISGVPLEVLSKGLVQAKKARLEILSVMEKTISAPRAEISKFAPHVKVIAIDPDRIGEVIGPGGKVINGIIARTGVTIDIDESGKVFVAARDKSALEAGVKEVESILHEFKVGEIVEGNVVRILDFGAIVDLSGGKDGMIHVSELKEGFVKNVTDVVNVGDFVRAKVIKVEEGKIGLSIKQLKE